MARHLSYLTSRSFPGINRPCVLAFILADFVVCSDLGEGILAMNSLMFTRALEQREDGAVGIDNAPRSAYKCNPSFQT